MTKEEMAKRWCDYLRDDAINRPNLLSPERAINMLKGAYRMADFLGNSSLREHAFRHMVEVSHHHLIDPNSSS